MRVALNAGRWALGIALGLGSLHCGGEQFSSDGAAASAGTGGTGGRGAGASGGTAGAAGASGGAAGAAAGGVGGAGAGGVGTGGSGQGGSGQGGSGQGGSGQGGSGQGGSGQGGSGVVPTTLDLQDCGPDLFGTGILPTLYSTLDSADAITAPSVGELGFVGNADGDYPGGRCGLAINIDQSGDYIKYHYRDNGYRHFDPFTGTLDFWYLPSYSHHDGVEHRLFGSANWDLVGGLRLRKAGGDEENQLQVLIRGAQLDEHRLEVFAGDYSFEPNVWVRITLVWYLAEGAAPRGVRLYVDGALVGQWTPTDAFKMDPDEFGFFVAGIWTFGETQHASGFLDELKVLPRGP